MVQGSLLLVQIGSRSEVCMYSNFLLLQHRTPLLLLPPDISSAVDIRDLFWPFMLLDETFILQSLYGAIIDFLFC